MTCASSPDSMPDMSGFASSSITELLRVVRSGDPQAREELFRRVYPELKRLAGHLLSRRAKGVAPMNATTLVHDACRRLLERHTLDAADRREFFWVFCRAMEDEWTERARADLAIKRGGDRHRVQMTDDPAEFQPDALQYLDLKQALTELRQHDPGAAEVVNLRFYCAAGLEECAEILGCTLADVRRDWAYAKSWLHSRLAQTDATAHESGSSEP